MGFRDLQRDNSIFTNFRSITILILHKNGSPKTIIYRIIWVFSHLGCNVNGGFLFLSPKHWFEWKRPSPFPKEKCEIPQVSSRLHELDWGLLRIKCLEFGFHKYVKYIKIWITWIFWDLLCGHKLDLYWGSIDE